MRQNLFEKLTVPQLANKFSTVYETGNRWQDELRNDGRIVGGEEWEKKVYNREEWKKLLRTSNDRHILHMAME
jgi:hypothetical protein